MVSWVREKRSEDVAVIPSEQASGVRVSYLDGTRLVCEFRKRHGNEIVVLDLTTGNRRILLKDAMGPIVPIEGGKKVVVNAW